MIEDTFSMGRPGWTIGGGIFSNEISVGENMKLRCLNGAHSTLAYLGQLLFGRETVASAMEFGRSRMCSMICGRKSGKCCMRRRA